MEQLIPKFKTFSEKIKTDILLKGVNIDSEEFDSRNSKIIYLVQDYIFKTKRFWVFVWFFFFLSLPLSLPFPYTMLLYFIFEFFDFFSEYIVFNTLIFFFNYFFLH